MSDSQHQKSSESIKDSLILFARLSVWVATPVVLAHFLGSWLDEKYETGYIFLISIVGFSFLVSMFGLIRETSRQYKKICDKDKRQKINGRHK